MHRNRSLQIRRRPRPWAWVGIALAAAAALFGFVTTSQTAGDRIYWKWEQARAIMRDALYRRSDTLPVAATRTAEASRATPAATVPPLSASLHESAATPTHAPTAAPAATPVHSPTPIHYNLVDPPPSYQLTGFRHEYQTTSNCGPATLAMGLSYWGWSGDQAVVAQVLKPQKRDKNVRWDELVYYVRTQAGWLDALFRVGGEYETLQLFVANGYPVIIETGYYVNGMWVGHYLLVTGYDVAAQTVTVHDATAGPDQVMTFAAVDELWRQFNRLFIVVFRAGERDKIEFMLGDDAEPDANRLNALRQTEAAVAASPDDAFAWFSYGSNLNYFDRYEEAAVAFDRAREIGLPWRMLFYQFGPYIAYFNVGRHEDVVQLANATLAARPDLEESYIWRGWARHMQGDTQAAITDFYNALEVNPNFNDALNALAYFGER